MVKDGLLERYRSREARNIVLGGETTATVVRYGLPGTVSVVRDTEGAVNAVAGECTRLVKTHRAFVAHGDVSPDWQICAEANVAQSTLY